jgi:hypothetical protein
LALCISNFILLSQKHIDNFAIIANDTSHLDIENLIPHIKENLKSLNGNIIETHFKKVFKIKKSDIFIDSNFNNN